MPKKLYRSNSNVMVAGVLAGIGEYLNIDPTVIRVIFAILMIMTAIFPLVITYFVLSIIIPKSDVYIR
ncbi:MAG: PspC domain-containing protein [Amphibacillus sp.]|nr:PspC domain-containing protein [Amphibacillus sp.]